MSNDKDLAAFPVLAFDKVGDESYVPGLTKREYFAGLAMQGILANQGCDPFGDMRGVADQATVAADALLSHLSNTKQ